MSAASPLCDQALVLGMAVIAAIRSERVVATVAADDGSTGRLMVAVGGDFTWCAGHDAAPLFSVAP